MLFTFNFTGLRDESPYDIPGRCTTGIESVNLEKATRILFEEFDVIKDDLRVELGTKKVPDWLVRDAIEKATRPEEVNKVSHRASMNALYSNREHILDEIGIKERTPPKTVTRS